MTAQITDVIPSVFMHEFIVGLLLVAIAIFGAVAIRSRGIKSFQFQISVFIMIWILGELVDILQDLGLLNLYNSETGMQIHLASMIFFSLMIWLRFYFSKIRQKRIVEAPKSDYF